MVYVTFDEDTINFHSFSKVKFTCKFCELTKVGKTLYEFHFIGKNKILYKVSYIQIREKELKKILNNKKVKIETIKEYEYKYW